MARNPLYNDGRTDAQNNGLTHDNKASNPNKKYSQGMNTFNNTYRQAQTERFADVTPFMYLDCVGRDKIPFKSFHKLSSYTLKSPMMDEIYKHKFYSLVPYKAILPNTWELFYANPTKGDDVPDDVYCNVNLIKKIYEYAAFLIRNVADTSVSISVRMANLIEGYLALESCCSTGSLLAHLKYCLWPIFNFSFGGRILSLDNIIDTSVSEYASKYTYLSVEVQPDNFVYFVSSPEAYESMLNSGLSLSASKFKLISIHTYLDYIREGYGDLFPLINLESTSADEAVGNLFDDLIDLATTSLSYYWNYEAPGDWNLQLPDNVGYDIDLSAVIAYQTTCVSQVTDASIDYLFNANLFRNVLFPLPRVDQFYYNGQYFLYETFSKRYLDGYWFNTNNFARTCQKLFSFAKSLKFGDYFTQMRPQPYAVGDMTIDTSDGLDAIEVTRKIVYQRFLNWNNRVGPKYEDYIKELTGMSPMPDNTEPSLISHFKETVGSYEVENTGTAQLQDLNSVTTLLRNSSGGFSFDIVISEPSILLGLTSYDMERLYTRVMDRSHLKSDRFDFYNHMLQYTGDQDIKACEIDSMRSPDEPIGYNTKDIHYKMQVSIAIGGFVNGLSSWAFTSENNDGDMSLIYGINPMFIRNSNGDFDRFYSSLTGYSLGSYFHFILKYNNDLTDMQRAMDVAPDIL